MYHGNCSECDGCGSYATLSDNIIESIKEGYNSNHAEQIEYGSSYSEMKQDYSSAHADESSNDKDAFSDLEEEVESQIQQIMKDSSPMAPKPIQMNIPEEHLIAQQRKELINEGTKSNTIAEEINNIKQTGKKSDAITEAIENIKSKQLR